MSFVDASVLVAILNEEPGYEELEKKLSDQPERLYISPLVRFETIIALARIHIENSKGSVDRPAIIEEARIIVDEVVTALNAREVAVDSKVGNLAMDAAIKFGKVAGHKAKLNFGDCFAYGAAKAYKLPLIYKGNDFLETDLR